MIYDILPVNNYQGNNSSTTFDFDFLIENNEQLKVTLFDEFSVAHELVCDVDYSINELNNVNGSYITFPISGSSHSLLSEKEKISLELVLPIEQLTQYTNSSLLNFSTLENSFDYLTRLIQILKRKLSLCVSVSECSENTPLELMESINDAHLSSQQSANVCLSNANLAKNYADIASVACEKTQDNYKAVSDLKAELIESGMFKFNLFDTKTSDHILEGNELKGWALQGTYVTKALYPDFYDVCLSQKEASIETEVVLGDSTLTMYVNNNGHQFYDIADKDIVDTFYETFGITDFYGIDEVNERVFLPRNKYFHQLTDDVSKVNEMVEAGLPNIEGRIGDATGIMDGAFYDTGAAAGGASTTANPFIQAGFDASRSNSIYGNSDTVQPPSSLKLLYYCVGNTVVNNANIDAGALVSQVESKANIQLDNVLPSQEFKKQSISWGIPDYTASSTIAFTVGTTWTVPYDCEIFFVQAADSGGGAIKLRLNNSSGAVIFYCGSSTNLAVSSDRARFKKGTVLYVERYSGVWHSNIIIPLTGVN